MEGPHVSREMLRRLALRELNPHEIAVLLRHIGECEECARVSDEDAKAHAELDAIVPALAADDGPWHPDHADITAFADGTAGPAEREIVESHLEDCRLCREDVADLARLRRGTARRSVWRVAFTTAAAAAIASAVFLQRSGNQPARTVPPVAPPVASVTHPATTTTAITAPPPPTPAPQLPKYANAEWERLVHNAIESERLPFAPGVATSPDILRGAGQETASQVAPSGVVVDATQPRFSWPAREGATYIVSIFSDDEPVAKSEPLTETHWTPPTALPRGRTYVWQVEATAAGTREIIPAPPAPPAMFRIVTKRDHDDLAAARRLHPDDHLLHAVLAARAGLREEAVEALSKADTKIRVR